MLKIILIILKLKKLIDLDLDLLPYTEDSEGNTNEFLRKFVEMLLDYMGTTFDRSSKILDFHHPEQLLELLDLTLPNEPQNIDQLLADCRDTLKYQVKTGQFYLFHYLS